MHGYGYESGQAPLDELLGQVLGGGAVQQGVKGQLISQIRDPEVQAELRSVARPLMIEGALYVAGAVAIVMLVMNRR